MRVTKLDPQNETQSSQIWQLFCNAYQIETQVLGLQDFPPLNRTIEEIRQAKTTFFGGWQKSDLVAVIEVEGVGTEWLHINSLGVAPSHLRQGFGTQLLHVVLELPAWQRITVSTAAANTPALQLYKNAGFHLQKHWSTPDNIPMVTLISLCPDF